MNYKVVKTESQKRLIITNKTNSEKFALKIGKNVTNVVFDNNDQISFIHTYKGNKHYHKIERTFHYKQDYGQDAHTTTDVEKLTDSQFNNQIQKYQ